MIGVVVAEPAAALEDHLSFSSSSLLSLDDGGRGINQAVAHGGVGLLTTTTTVKSITRHSPIFPPTNPVGQEARIGRVPSSPWRQSVSGTKYRVHASQSQI